MARVVCDKCNKGYITETGKIKKLYDLDVCYICGGYEPVVEKVEEVTEVTVETTCEGYSPVEA